MRWQWWDNLTYWEETIESNRTCTPGETNINNNNNRDGSAEADDPSTSTTQENTNTFDINFFDKLVTVDVNKKVERTVINLSSYDLKETDISVLLKGLKFCPTPGEPQIGQVLDDLSGFFRRMRLQAYFNDPETDAMGIDNSQPTIEQSFNRSLQSQTV
jgi:hypothetical protein